MTQAEIEKKQKDIRAWRLQARLMLGFFIATIFVFGRDCIVSVQERTQAVLSSGKDHDRFVGAIEKEVGKSILPQTRSILRRNLGEIQPLLRRSIDRVDEKSPEVAASAVDDLKKLRADLEVSSRAMLVEKLGSGRSVIEAYPASRVNPLIPTLDSILASLAKIRNDEAPKVKGVKPTWDMALMVLEEMHREVDLAKRPGGGK